LRRCRRSGPRSRSAARDCGARTPASGGQFFGSEMESENFPASENWPDRTPEIRLHHVRRPCLTANAPATVASAGDEKVRRSGSDVAEKNCGSRAPCADDTASSACRRGRPPEPAVLPRTGQSNSHQDRGPSRCGWMAERADHRGPGATPNQEIATMGSPLFHPRPSRSFAIEKRPLLLAKNTCPPHAAARSFPGPRGEFDLIVAGQKRA